MISGAQIRAARGLLNWTAKDLADKAGMMPNTVTAFENSKGRTELATIQKMVVALEESGLEFTATGVQLVSPMYGFNGENWFLDLLADIRSSGAREVVIQNADDRKTPETILSVIHDLLKSGVTFRLTSEQGNNHFTMPKASYRWIPSAYFKNWVTVIYADRVAFSIAGETGCRVIRDADLAASMINQFNLIWDMLPEIHDN